jgi:hypothetical protein
MVTDIGGQEGRGGVSAREAWARLKSVVLRDYPWLVLSLVLLLLLFYSVGRAADAERVVFERYRPFVITCYENYGIRPSFEVPINFSLHMRNNASRYLDDPGARFGE